MRQESEHVGDLAVKVHGHNQPIGIAANVEHDHRLSAADMHNVRAAIASFASLQLKVCGKVVRLRNHDANATTKLWWCASRGQRVCRACRVCK